MEERICLGSQVPLIFIMFGCPKLCCNKHRSILSLTILITLLFFAKNVNAEHTYSTAVIGYILTELLSGNGINGEVANQEVARIKNILMIGILLILGIRYYPGMFLLVIRPICLNYF